MVQIDLQAVDVDGVDITGRALSLRKLLLGKSNSNKPTAIPILRDINFKAEKGDKIGIVGRNGSGKSSLLKVIAGIYPISQGNMNVSGRIAPLIEMGIGFDSELSGRQNIKLGLLYSGRIHEYSKEFEEMVIDFSELKDHIDLPLKNYSSGMVARLAFSTSIFQEPDILLLDEVFAAGDSSFLAKSKDLMAKKFERVPISILVNHDSAQILDMCNKCFWMENGRILMSGEPKEVVAAYEKGNH